MVYCGKPSKGCQMCRTRRIKCDEAKPTCNQCAKSRRQCPGYKDDFDLVFRNETQATERRARRSLTTKRSTLSAGGAKQIDHQHIPIQLLVDSAAYEEELYHRGLAGDHPASVHGALRIPLEQQALCYFLSNWVLMPHDNIARGHLDFLIPLIKNEEPGGHLSIAFTAVGLAALGNRPHSKRLLPLAGMRYAQALNLTNIALRNPVTAKTDQTLASVLLLGMFEGITTCRSNIMGWGSHIDGAVTIIKLRGKKSLRTQVGKSLFAYVRSQMIVNCLSNSKAPEMGTDWWIYDAVKDDVTQEVTRLNLRGAELRADINQFVTTAKRDAKGIEQMKAIMRRAQVLDREYEAWEESVPEEWKPKAVAWLDNVQNDDFMRAPIFPGKVDMYTNIWQASIWNHERSTRLVVSGTVVRCIAWLCAPTDYRTTPEYATAARTGAKLISDMIASVPFHLGWTYDRDSGRLVHGDLSGFACGGQDDVSGRALGGSYLVWPLFSANCSDFTTDAQRKYLTGRLRYIAENMGINQASVLSYLQLRLPSMVVRRDGTGIAYPTSKTLAATNSSTADLPDPSAAPVLPSSQNNQQDPAVATMTIGPASVDAAKISIGGKGISYPKSTQPKKRAAASTSPYPIKPAPVSVSSSGQGMDMKAAKLIHDPSLQTVSDASSQASSYRGSQSSPSFSGSSPISLPGSVDAIVNMNASSFNSPIQQQAYPQSISASSSTFSSPQGPCYKHSYPQSTPALVQAQQLQPQPQQTFPQSASASTLLGQQGYPQFGSSSTSSHQQSYPSSTSVSTSASSYAHSQNPRSLPSLASFPPVAHELQYNQMLTNPHPSQRLPLPSQGMRQNQNVSHGQHFDQNLDAQRAVSDKERRRQQELMRSAPRYY